ncbi:hypothetical protein C0991_009311 [Blastosporella zonata]|nr:hypothetical protein C0991_009311 [Blastosporella zonata]
MASSQLAIDPRLSTDGYVHNCMPFPHPSLANHPPNFGPNGLRGGFSDNQIYLLDELTNQHTQYHKEVKSIKKEVFEIRKELSAALSKIKGMLKSPTTKNTTNILPVPDHDKIDYPNIKYWMSKQYHAAKKERKSLTGLPQHKDKSGNIMTWYVETEDGKPVDSNTVDAI